MSAQSLELFGVGRVQPEPDWFTSPHQHPYNHELIVIQAGRMTLRTPKTEFTAKRGDILFYPSGLIHEEISHPSDPVQTVFMSFRGKGIDLNLPIRVSDTDGRIREMANWLLRDRLSLGEFKKSQSLFQAIIEELHRLKAGPTDPWLQDVRNYLNEHFARPLTLDQIAKTSGMTRFSFVRKFRQLTGSTPMKELRLIRLNEARRMILANGGPLKTIAPAVGLGDEYQLSKLFRKHFRFSPSEFRARRSIR